MSTYLEKVVRAYVSETLLTLVFDTLMIRGARKRGQHFKVLSSFLLFEKSLKQLVYDFQ